MDVMLKILLEESANGIDIWVATNGIFVTGHTVGMVDFLDRYTTLRGKSEGSFRKKVDEMMAEANIEPEQTTVEKSDPQVVLFSDAKIYGFGKILFSGPVSLNADLIAAWGPGVMEPVFNPNDYIPR